MKGNSKNLIIIGVIVIAIAVAGYFYFTRDQSSDEALTSAAADTYYYALPNNA